MCHDITVPADMIVEGSETFTISVETSNPNDVILGPSTATVTVVDNDGKKIQHGVMDITINCLLVYTDNSGRVVSVSDSSCWVVSVSDSSF